MPPAASSKAETSSMALARVTQQQQQASTSQAEAAAGALAVSGAGSAPGGKQSKIPAFLQKLYTMVDSPETESLIYWSEGGDSFFVPNHEAFGKELLPRFFKHSNFSSFVRQLNMYGFHKVPHMQQGVLEPNSSSELWEFTNPNFQRGQQHLLPLVTRKKAIHPTIEHPDGYQDGGGPSGSGGASSSAKVDVPAILNSIATIRAQQTALTADLKELQQSNQHLWTEALAARERHKQHQDTTDRILRFLAGVFGQGAAGDIASGVGGDGGNHSVSSAVRAAKETMMGGAGGGLAGRTGAGAAGGNHHASSGGVIARNRGLMIQDGGQQQASAGGMQSTLAHDEPLEEISADRFMEVSPTPTPTPTANSAPTPTDPTSTALVPRTPHGGHSADINQYFNFSGQPQAGPSSSAPAAAQLSLDAFTPSFLADFASAVGPLSPATLNSLAPANAQALDKSYQSADAISTEVDTLQASIEDLVASLGLAGELRPDGSWDPPPADSVSDVAAQYTGGDFDMESFLSDLTGSAPTPAAATGATTATGGCSRSGSADSSLPGFDSPPAATPDGAIPPLTVPSPAEVSAKRASKRKSDVAFTGDADGGAAAAVDGAGGAGKSQRLV